MMRKYKKTFVVAIILLFVTGISSICFAAKVKITEQGIKYFNSGKYAQALACLKEGAKKQDPEAMLYLGQMYRLGFGVMQNGSKAVEWYKKAANKGNTEAMRMLGILYSARNTTPGIECDEHKSAEWFRKAANAGDAFSMCCLGSMYCKGEEAKKWLKKAAKLGVTEEDLEGTW